MNTLPFPSLADHPALPGHFPGHPIIPGVVLLDLAQGMLENACGRQAGNIAMAKFMSPAGPYDALSLEYEMTGSGVRFVVCSADRRIASGRFEWLAEDHDKHDRV